MAALPIILNTFRVAINWQNGGQNAVNVMHIHVPGGATPVDVLGAMDRHASVSMWNTTILAATVTSIDITPLDGTTATQSFVPLTPGRWQGGGGGTEWVPAAAPVVKLTTALRGRSFRGRVFLPFTAENEMVNGSVRSLILPGMQGAWNTFISGLAGDALPCNLAVASYKLAVATNVLIALVEPTLGTQRRRQTRLR